MNKKTKKTLLLVLIHFPFIGLLSFLLIFSMLGIVINDSYLKKLNKREKEIEESCLIYKSVDKDLTAFSKKYENEEWGVFSDPSFSVSFEYPKSWFLETDPEEKSIELKSDRNCKIEECDYVLDIREEGIIDNSSDYYPYQEYFYVPGSAKEYACNEWLNMLNEERKTEFNRCITNGDDKCSRLPIAGGYVFNYFRTIDLEKFNVFNYIDNLSVLEIYPYGYGVDNSFFVYELKSKRAYLIDLSAKDFNPIGYPMIINQPKDLYSGHPNKLSQITINEDNVLVKIMRSINFGLDVEENSLEEDYSGWKD